MNIYTVINFIYTIPTYKYRYTDVYILIYMFETVNLNVLVIRNDGTKTAATAAI